MSDTAILSSWFYIPLSLLGEGGAAHVRARLTHRSPYDEPNTPPLRLYCDTSKPGYLGVPRAWGLQNFPAMPVDDQTVLGEPIQPVARLPDPNHPRVKDPEKQAAFMDQMESAWRHHKTMTAMAATGSGKTVCGLRTAAVLGRKTLVLLHLERLMVQWAEEIADKLGVPEERIGLVQQDRCEWEGKDFCVGLLHSVCRRDYGDDFRNAFGTVIFDEVHKVGSRFFAPAVSQFPARYKMGLSATMDRKDGGERVYFSHLGPIRVTSKAEALPMSVHVLDYSANKPPKGRNRGSIVKSLSFDDTRNALIVKQIKRMYDAGRQGLVVSDSVIHLQRLMVMAKRAGVPYGVMGQYTGERQEYVPDPNNPLKKVLNKRKLTKDQLDKVKAEAQLIFATYGMMTEGIDIPRLDAGIDATPRGAATQLVGRIRRPMPGKRKPVWVTIRDVHCPQAVRWFDRRCKDYRTTGAEIIHHGSQKNGTDRSTTRSAQAQVLGGGTQSAAARTLPQRSGLPPASDGTGARELPTQTRGGRASGADGGLPGKPRIAAGNRHPAGGPLPGRRNSGAREPDG